MNMNNTDVLTTHIRFIMIVFMIITFIAIIKIYNNVNSHDALYDVNAIKCISKKIPRLLFILDFFHKFLSAASVLFIFL